MDGMLRDAQRRLGQAAEVQERLKSLVGQAASADGRVKVQCTNEKGVTSIDLDPRAMRMASAELAETLVTVIQEAMTDLRTQSQSITREVFGGDSASGDIGAARVRMKEAGDSFERAMNDAQGEMERVLRTIGQQAPWGDDR
jgi:DNA-binding protein YbaB